MFELQMQMNKLSQLSEMSAGHRLGDEFGHFVDGAKRQKLKAARVYAWANQLIHADDVIPHVVEIRL